MKKTYPVPDRLEIINLGSTFAKYGFDYRYFNKRGFNFAQQPQTMKTDLDILERYQEHLTKNALVLIVLLCPFSFSLYEQARPSILHTAPVRVKKFIKDLIGYSQKQRATYDLLPPEEKSRIASSNRINGWMEEFSISNTTTTLPSTDLLKTFSKNIDILQRMLLLCDHKGFHPVILNMPAAKIEYSRFSSHFIREFYTANIEKGNITNAPVLNYFGDSRFDDIHLYENFADCFNDQGRKLFSEILIQDLKSINLWEANICN